jgi:ABC-2 type transport system ATP-binding protein
MSQIAIEVDNLSKKFKLSDDRQDTFKKYFLNPLSLITPKPTNEFLALQHVSFQVRRGEFLGIVGRNGSGKSTLLKILAGIYTPDKGSVKVHGRIVPFLELGVGFNPELTGKENVFLNGVILGMTRSFLEKKYQEIVEFAELEKFMDMPIKNYSSGMMVRLAFSIAVQADADIYILDEILAVGDALFQKKSLRIINEFRKQGKTVLYVSHSMADVAKHCDSAILIDKGHLVLAGTPNKVIEQYEQLNADLNEQTYKQSEAQATARESRKYKIKQIRLLNAKLEEQDTFATGDTMVVEAQFEKFADIDVFHFNLGIHSIDDKIPMTGIHTRREDFQPNKDGIVRVTFENIALNEGAYHLSSMIAGAEDTDPYHVIPMVLKFHVKNATKIAGGRVFMPHKWENVSA